MPLINAEWLSHWTTSESILILILISAMAFAASSETAYFSLNRFQLRRIKERYRGAYDRIRTLLARPSRLLILILLVTELVNLAISSMITEFMQHRPGVTSSLRDGVITALASMAVSIPLLLMFGEITPKVIAAKMNKFVAVTNSKPLILLYTLLKPFLSVFDSIIGWALKRFKAEGKDYLSKTMSVLSEDDFMLLMEEGHREGTVHQAERKLIKNVLEFDDSVVMDVATPIDKIFAISDSERVLNIFNDIKNQGYSRVPVYHKAKKNIVGLLYVKDLLALKNSPELDDLLVRDAMSEVMKVGPNTKLSVLFRRFKDQRMHMAVIYKGHGEEKRKKKKVNAVDGEVVGIVTMEDVLESIFGAIEDERDVQ